MLSNAAGHDDSTNQLSPVNSGTRRRAEYFTSLKRKRQESIAGSELPPHVEAIEKSQTPTIEDLGGSQPDITCLFPEEYLHVDNTMRFSKGALILLRLQNFQIAQDSLYRFEPYLNLILGGNGTGKSAIINAIFLLFLGNLSDLRQNYYGAFVRHGQAWGAVTALFKGQRGSYNDKNIVLSMCLSASRTHGGGIGRKLVPQWYLNGEAVPASRVWDLVCEFNIKVNNLCQFLPQFRVAAFSGESPQERLISTEEAIGYPGMADDHKFLSENCDNLNEHNDEITALKPEIETLESRREQLEKTVENIRETQKNEEELEVLKRVLDISRYMSTEAEIRAIETSLEEAKQELEGFDNYVTDDKEFIERVRVRINRYSNRLNLLKEGGEHDEMVLTRYLNTIKTTMNNIDDQRARAQNVINQHKLKSNSLSKLKMQVSEEKLQLKSLKEKIIVTGSPSVEEYNKKISALEGFKTRVRTQLEKCESQSTRLEQLKNTCGKKEYQINLLKQKLETMSSRSEFRDPSSLERYIRNDRGSIQTCLNLYKREKSQFREEIIPPAILSLNITDPRIKDIFSSLASISAVSRFVCQNREDQIKFDRLSKQQRGARLLVTSLKGVPNNSKFAGKEEWLRSLGFDGVIMDKLSGPEPIMNYFKTLNFHNIPYSLKPLTAIQISEMKKFYENGYNDSTLIFADINSIHRISRSRFGKRAILQQTEKVKPAQEFVKFMLKKDDSNQHDVIQRDITTLEASINKYRMEIESLEPVVSQLTVDLNTLRSEELDMRRGIAEEMKLREKYQRLLSSVNSMEEKIDHESEILETMNVEGTIAKLKEAVEMASKLQPPPNILSRVLSHFYTNEIINTLQSDSVTFVEAIESEILSSREKILAKIDNFRRKIEEVRQSTQKAYESYELASGWLRKKKILKISREKAKNTSYEDLQKEHKQIIARIALNRSAESLDSILANLERTNTQLRDLKHQLETHMKSQEEITSRIASVKERYVSELEAMIPKVNAKFSELFSATKCRGTVTLNKANEVKIGTWGIDINVAFRDNETLTRLSRQRQSGGERAITTAFYLMALQDQSNAPFRVLDEINQGMDEKNERITMQFLVDFSCAKATRPQQYFLVTPKLIPNIHTHPRMNAVLIIGGTSVEETDNLIPVYNNELRLERLRKVVAEEK